LKRRRGGRRPLGDNCRQREALPGRFQKVSPRKVHACGPRQRRSRACWHNGGTISIGVLVSRSVIRGIIREQVSRSHEGHEDSQESFVFFVSS
jgi:hypothetical protein